MAGELSRACRRIVRRAVAASTGTFCLAIVAGLGAWVVAAPAGLPGSTGLAAALLPGAPAELRPDGPTLGANGEQGALVTIVPVNSGALIAGRESLVAAAQAERVAAEEAERERLAAEAAAEAQPLALASVAPLADLQPGDTVQATLSYYYCDYEEGAPAGDGGGFCGAMRNGQVVHDGAAACSAAYLGQRFRIVGDPTGREYYCADTGSAVFGQHRDIWFETNAQGAAWQSAVGRHAVIEILP